jgi:hypothetical protein
MTHRNYLDDTKTKGATHSWEEHGNYLFIDHAVSGVELA